MRSPPEDAWHGAYAIFFLQGIGQLFPFNAFINAEDYFRRRFCGSSFEAIFEDSILFGYNIVALLGLMLALRYQDRFDVRGRIMGSLAVTAVAFGVCILLVFMEAASAGLLFWVTMLCVLFSGFAVAILQAGLFAMASAFPPKYTQAMMAGQGLAGLVVALAAMFTTLAGPDDTSCIASAATISGATNKLDRLTTADAYSAAQMFTSSACSSYSVDWSTLVYFTIAVAVLLGCIATYPVLERLPLTTFYMQPCGVNASQGGEVTICSAAKTGDSHHRHSCGQNSIPRSGNCASVTEIGQLDSMHHRLVEQRSPSRSPRPLLSPGKPLSDGNTVLWDQDDCEGGEESGSAGGRNGTVTGDGARPMLRIRSKLAPIAEYAFAVFMVFAVTLSIFPGATSEIVSSRRCLPGRARFFSDDIFMLFSFVSFNTFDFLGRLAAGAKSVIAPKHLPHAAVMRLVFVPLFLACRSENSRLSQWLSADAFPLMLMPVFAMTSGYVGSLSMMAGSQKGPFAGTAMVLSLSAGLLAGSLLSFVVLFVTTGKMI